MLSKTLSVTVLFCVFPEIMKAYCPDLARHDVGDLRVASVALAVFEELEGVAVVDAAAVLQTVSVAPEVGDHAGVEGEHVLVETAAGLGVEVECGAVGVVGDGILA